MLREREDQTIDGNALSDGGGMESVGRGKRTRQDSFYPRNEAPSFNGAETLCPSPQLVCAMSGDIFGLTVRGRGYPNLPDGDQRCCPGQPPFSCQKVNSPEHQKPPKMESMKHRLKTPVVLSNSNAWQFWQLLLS